MKHHIMATLNGNQCLHMSKTYTAKLRVVKMSNMVYKNFTECVKFPLNF